MSRIAEFTVVPQAINAHYGFHAAYVVGENEMVTYGLPVQQGRKHGSGWTPRPTAERSAARIAATVKRCQDGKLAPARALTLIEPHAELVDVDVYDKALDDIDVVAQGYADQFESITGVRPDTVTVGGVETITA